MNRKTLLWVITPLALVGAYYFVYRHRQPYLEVLPNVDWQNRVPTIQFGNNTEALSEKQGVVDAGRTYSSKYKLFYKTDKNIMTLEVVSNYGKVIQKMFIDFRGKLIY